MVQLNPVSFFSEKKYQYHLTEIFDRNVRSNGTRLGLISQKATLHVQHTSFVLLTWNFLKYTF